MSKIDTRFVLVRLHRYAGLATALFLIVAGLTGTVIAFSAELDAWLNPELLTVASKAPPLMPDALALKVSAQLPDAQVSYLPLDTEPGEAAVVRVEGRDGKELPYDQVFVDTTDGRVLGKREWGQCCFARERIIPFLYLTHYSLSMPGVWGILLMGIVSLIWAVDCFVGFTLSLPRGGPFWRKWAPAWLIKTDASTHRLNVDLHRAAGLWLWGVLFVVALSGVALNLPDQVFRPLVSVFSPLKPSMLETAASRFQAHPKPALLSFDDAIARAAEAAHRPIKVTGVLHYPEYAAYGVGFAAPGENGRDGMGSSWLYIDDRTGKVVAQDLMGEGSAGDVFMQAQYPLHSGRILGLTGRIVVSVTGLVVAMLSLTGILIWLKKRRAAGVHRQRLRARELLQDHAAGGVAGAEGA
ncbi:MAG TPA: PepSY-associated TM helix domain-containing protein [Rhizomicrobium sp.]|nr:PepSY-associated TM helix domain-containing protein [Rhizomicrobium sp.]